MTARRASGSFAPAPAAQVWLLLLLLLSVSKQAQEPTMKQLAFTLLIAFSGLAVAVPAYAEYDHHEWHHCHRVWHHHHWERVCR